MSTPESEDILTRDEFRRKVKERDESCVLCDSSGEDVHHILDRKLFKNGGYYIKNGVFVCSDCHLRCEKTLIHPEDIYSELGFSEPFKHPILPSILKEGFTYDKWGNIRLKQKNNIGRELFIKGPMYNTDSFQTILKDYLSSNQRFLRKYFDCKFW